MIPTLVITLREGLEASLIVGIVAAFLVRQGRRDALRMMWIGVGLAVTICAAVAVTLRVVGNDLPQQQQEGLETIIGLVAVSMITYMVVWMKRHSRELKGALEGEAASALASGSSIALIGMAFLAVLREGFETAVFLLAAFQDTTDPTAAGSGAVIGLAAAILLGWALYKGGVRINLSKFFRATGLVLVLVAAGLLATALHTAHEATWFNGLQSQALDLTWLVKPGTVTGSLLTGMLGLQPAPTVGELLVYLVYAIPMALYVVWPDSWRPTRLLRRGQRRAATGTIAQAAIAITGLVALGAFVAGCGAGDDAPAGATKLAYKISDAGCSPASAKAPAGPVTVDVSNDGSSKVTELEILDGSDRILGERENIATGLNSSFSLTLEPGEYTVYCPNGSDVERAKLTVTGTAKDGGKSSAAAAMAVARYRRYIEKNTTALVAATKPFAAAVETGDLDKARRLYPVARVPYERVEPVAESFGDLDPRIDARAGDVPRDKWTGFHPLEKAIFADGSLRGAAPLARRLVADVETLQSRARRIKLQVAQIANGANALLDEVSASKITGEEERYSHVDLVDFEANVQGAKAAFDAVHPLLATSDPELAGQISDEFTDVNRTLGPYRKGASFVPYGELTKQDTRGLSQSIDALAEPLSQVAAKIVQ